MGIGVDGVFAKLSKRSGYVESTAMLILIIFVMWYVASRIANDYCEAKSTVVNYAKDNNESTTVHCIQAKYEAPKVPKEVNRMRYQYKVHNEKISLLITTGVCEEDYVKELALTYAEEQMGILDAESNGIKCDLVRTFNYESIIDITEL